MKILIIIPTYKRPNSLKKALYSIRSNFFEEIKLEVLVIFNGGDRETQSIIKEFQKYNDFFDIQVINGKQNYFWSKSILIGLRYLDKNRFSHYALMNDDVILSKNFFEKIYLQNQKHKRTIISSSIIDEESSNIYSSVLKVNFKTLSIKPKNVIEEEGAYAASTRFALFPIQSYSRMNEFPLRVLPHYFADILYTLNLNLQGFRILPLEEAFATSNLEITRKPDNFLSRKFNKKSSENYPSLVIFWTCAFFIKTVYSCKKLKLHK